jgi:hypothetical protein
MKRITILLSILSFAALIISCDKGDLSVNPNAAGENAIISPDLFVNRLGNELYNGGGVLDKVANSQLEGPWNQVMRWNQYFVSNYPYYWGNNFYNWSNTCTNYTILKYATLMQQQVVKQGPANLNANAYLAIVKFFKAYSFIWYTQRVGDIPMSQAGNPNNIYPIFDSQHDVYKNSLALLDTANTLLGGYITSSGQGGATLSGGDIYGLTNLQWQKVINTYRLRVLISLSKKAGAADAADIGVAAQFANIVNNPTTYPIMTSNADNLQYKYNGIVNFYPIKQAGNGPYSIYENISNTYLNLTTPVKDPRTFIAATPAPAQITGGKQASDFTAYVGSDISMGVGDLLTNSTNGAYSFTNYRYYKSTDGTGLEPYIIIGYPEMCFNIAEAINRGWGVTGSSTTWYNNGISASISMYGLTQGQTYAVNDRTGTFIGNVTIDIATFMTNVAYQGDNASGLTQILQQKYVAMFQNSGWEAFYNWRRTGVPAFSQGGSGIGTAGNAIPRRWLYDVSETVANQTNYSAALSSQYGGTDDVTKDIWALQ